MLDRATLQGRILLTEDDDFFRIAARWWMDGRDFIGIIHVDQDAATIGSLIEDIALITECYSNEEMLNRIEYVPL